MAVTLTDWLPPKMGGKVMFDVIFRFLADIAKIYVGASLAIIVFGYKGEKR